MSGFLQGIALRGAGLYPAAAPPLRRSPAAQFPGSVTEISAESDAEFAGSDAEKTAVRTGKSPLPLPGIDGRDEPRRAAEPPRPEVLEIRAAPTSAPRETEPVAHVQPPPPRPDPKPAALKPQPVSTSQVIESIRPRHIESTAPARAEAVHVAAQREDTPTAEKPIPRAEVKAVEPRAARVILQPADAKPMILMASSPAQQPAVAAPDLEPRPVEVRIGSIEVRATAPQKPQPPARAAAPVESGFGAYLRMRTYRSHSR